MARGWTKGQKEKFRATMALKKSALQQNKCAVPVDQAQEPAVDIRRIEQYNYRRGLMTALDCIMRELRDAY